MTDFELSEEESKTDVDKRDVFGRSVRSIRSLSADFNGALKSDSPEHQRRLPRFELKLPMFLDLFYRK
jgi:hypothetical protein